MADVALDDYIKTKHITRSGKGPRGAARGGRGAGRGGAPRGSGRLNRGGRFSGGVVKSPSQRRSGGPQNLRTANGSGQGRWEHDLYGASGAGAMGGLRSRGAAAGAKLIVSNLHFGVSDNDLKDLFGELGLLRKASVHYDNSGRSLGTGEISYQTNSDALQAFKRYNGVPLDGQAMEIQMVTIPGMGMGAPGGLNPLPRRGLARGAGMRAGGIGGRLSRGGPRGGGGSARGGRGGRRGGSARGGAAAKRTAKPEVTQEQLDMELDAYQTTA